MEKFQEEQPIEQESILSEIKKDTGLKYYYLLGDNGTGKSRFLSKISSDKNINRPILMMSFGISDRFKFSKKLSNRVYLGQRNSSNAIFLANREKEISKLLLDNMIKEGMLKEIINKNLGIEFVIELPKEENMYDARSLRRLKEPPNSKQNSSSEDDARKKKREENEKKFNENKLAISELIKSKKTEFEIKDMQLMLTGLDYGLNITTKFKYKEQSNSLDHIKEEISTPLNELSSGYQVKILLLARLTNNIKDNSIVLIDEPETSMHIKWQNIFHSELNSIIQDCGIENSTIVVATHSPAILTSAIGDNVNSYHFKPGNIVNKISRIVSNIEENQFKHFDYLSPENSTLLEFCSELIHATTHNLIEKEEALKRIMEKKSTTQGIKNGKNYEIIKATESIINDIK